MDMKMMEVIRNLISHALMSSVGDISRNVIKDYVYRSMFHSVWMVVWNLSVDMVISDNSKRILIKKLIKNKTWYDEISKKQKHKIIQELIK